MTKYIAIFHHRWMESKKFENVVLDVSSLGEAHCKALAIKEAESSMFNRVSYQILEIADMETMLEPVKPKGFFGRLRG